ncbi:hypothetical protein AB4Z22_11065 [Paenibacillus sp. TAF58]
MSHHRFEGLADPEEDYHLPKEQNVPQPNSLFLGFVGVFLI